MDVSSVNPTLEKSVEIHSTISRASCILSRHSIEKLQKQLKEEKSIMFNFFHQLCQEDTVTTICFNKICSEKNTKLLCIINQWLTTPPAHEIHRGRFFKC